MAARKKLDAKQKERMLQELRRDVAQRKNSYRERALSLFPHVCASCGREFSGIRLKELTVHHKDHNHDNNPPDGSNWELLCIYCHDNEHSRYEDSAAYSDGSSDGELDADSAFRPFANLDDLLKNKK